MMSRLTTACLQINSGPDTKANLESLAPMIEEARSRGARLITLPENTDFKVSDRDKLYALACSEKDHLALPFFEQIAKKTGTWILAGGLAIRTEHEKLANRSLLFNDQGKIVARYDKIHLFDADLNQAESYRESNSFRAGNQAVICDTPWGKIGLTICYDLRFPHLYRALAKAGATIITIPASFVTTTGKLHWHVLLRARAIETGCFILAPGQCGTHDGGRTTYGHSLIIAPNGRIIAEAGEDPTILTAELNLNEVEEFRHMLPCLKHDREFTISSTI